MVADRHSRSERALSARYLADHLRRSSLNTFGAWTGDRLAARRGDPCWMEATLRHASARLLPVWQSRSLVDDSNPPRAALLPATDWPGLGESGPRVVLGAEGDTVYFAVEVPEEPVARAVEAATGATFENLHRVGSLVEEPDASLLAYARGMLLWHRDHRFCARCGGRTRVREGGHLRVCGRCEAGQFPRLDPAIIVLVEYGQACLLGRQPAWDPGKYSCLAGFVEPGETLETAVAREVFEETGVRLGRVNYHSSQPWPFPSSLMLGFRAVAREEAIALGDELEDARWMSRDELRAALVEGGVSLPPPVSIAFRLIEDWYDEGGEPLRRVPNWRPLWATRRSHADR